MLKKAPVPFFLKFLTNKIGDQIGGSATATIVEQLDFLEEQLATSPDGGRYLAGTNLSGADILMIFPLQACRHKGDLTAAKYPKLNAYINLLEATDSYKRSVAKIVELEGSDKGTSLSMF